MDGGVTYISDLWVVSAQLVERTLPAPEDTGLNRVIDCFIISTLYTVKAIDNIDNEARN